MFAGNVFKRYPIVFLGLLVSLTCGGISLFLHSSTSVAFVVTITTIMLSITLEILIRIEPLNQFQILSKKQLEKISSDPKIHECITATIECYETLAVAKEKARFVYSTLELALNEHIVRLKRFSEGMFESNLIPDHLFREPDLLSAVKEKIVATSMVDPRTYWTTSWAKTYLTDQAVAQQKIREHRGSAHVAVDRIFIEERKNLRLLIPILRLHREAGIRARVAIFEEVPPNIRKDFMVVDDEFAYWLNFAQGTKMPISSTLITKVSQQSHLIYEYKQIFHSLEIYARDPQDIPILSRNLNSGSV